MWLVVVVIWWGGDLEEDDNVGEDVGCCCCCCGREGVNEVDVTKVIIGDVPPTPPCWVLDEDDEAAPRVGDTLSSAQSKLCCLDRGCWAKDDDFLSTCNTALLGSTGEL